MKLATTQEFRNAVRMAARELGITVGRTYTDKSKSAKADTGFRYVTFVVNENDDRPLLAARTESILATRGLTAQTRIGAWAAYYLRGNCCCASTTELA